MASKAVCIAVVFFGVLALAAAQAPGYFGCFTLDELAWGNQYGPGYAANQLTVQMCSEFCFGADQNYALLTKGNECQCLGGDITPSGAGTGTCDQYTQDGYEAGGANSFSAYYLGLFGAAPFLDQCWTNTVAPTTTTTIAQNTPNGCVLHCAQGGYSFAGTANGTTCNCYATDPLENGATGAKGACTTPCPGLWSGLCGGPNAMNLYTDDFLGCNFATTNEPFVFLPIPGRVTIPQCQNQCWELGYDLAGLQAGSRCLCATYDYSAPNVSPASSSLCNTKCSGDATTYCGGVSALSTYGAIPYFMNPTKPAGWRQVSNGVYFPSYYTYLN